MELHANTPKDTIAIQRTLMGPGPSDVSPRVLKAMSSPCIGHLDPYFLSVMDHTQSLLRFLFQTQNAFTIPVSGTGSAGMETCFVNFVEPGDTVLVCVNGVFGTRMCDIVNRLGGKLIRVDGEWGRAVDPEKVRQAVKDAPVKLIALVHAETSTGVCQPLDEIAKIAKDSGALLLVDMVTSLGGMDIAIDRAGIDIAYSGTQKCLSCPPGLSPVTFGPKAVEMLSKRKQPVPSWYLDMTMVQSYWGSERKYHHTAPINMIYALNEALCIISEEGLGNRFARHHLHHEALVAGVEAMGLSMFVPKTERLPMLNAISIPDGIMDVNVRKTLLNSYGIEIGGGLGPLAGKVWRVGLMGESCSRKNVVLLLSALESILTQEGFRLEKGAAVHAAAAVYKP